VNSGPLAGTRRFGDPERKLLCGPTPWGELVAVNMDTGDIAYRKTLGVSDMLPAGMQDTGRPSSGGVILTASGLTFVGGTDDFRYANNLFRRILEDEVLGEQLRLRMVAALDGPLGDTTLDTQIDSYIAETWPSMNRDWERWGADYRSYGGWSWRSDWTSPDQEVAYVRDWLDNRRTNLGRSYR
jgi:hypothetical protein